jgi:hypothetical protein
MSPETPMYAELIKSIVDNMNLANREELIAKLDEANTPNPEQEQARQQAAQQQNQAALEFQNAQTVALQGQAEESQARASKYAAEAQAVPQELEIDRIRAVTSNLKAGDADDKEFQKRLEISKQLLKEREVAVKEEQGNVEAMPEPQVKPPVQPEPQPPMMQPDMGQLPDDFNQ